MSTYSVADAENHLPRLIDSALEGEEVVISRQGKAVAELRSLAARSSRTPPAAYAWLRARRQARKPVGTSSIDLLSQLYEDPEV